MSEERWKSIISFIQFILGTVVLGIFGTIINHQIQTREIEIKEQELISKNLVTVLSQNSADKLLMAQFYAAVTRSEDIRKRWEIYRDELKNEIDSSKDKKNEIETQIEQSTDAKLKDQKQAVIEEIKANVTPGAKPVTSEELPARIYFHIQREDQREKALDIANQISSDPQFVVPGVQRLDSAPNKTELRYFKRAEEIETQMLAKKLDGLGIATVPKYVPGFESSTKLRPRHYELWISGQ